ncbi:Glutamate-1-semialdehyde 2,1-aminomutase [archaeon HR01]|nr:Glutamate-1-semialdehyde 2,1-aminomutase [archaeon HR01]
MVGLNRSWEHFNKVSKIIPGGVNSNLRFYPPHPIYFRRAEGPYIWDIDGNKYIDCVISHSGVILGYQYPTVLEAVEAALESGITTSYETELAYRVAKLIHDIVPSAEVVRFACTGSEAVAKAVTIAKGYTGRQWIVKCEGEYHGWYDPVHVSLFPSLEDAGQYEEPKTVVETKGLMDGVEKTLVVPYNDSEVLEKLLRKRHHDIACVLLEPVAHGMGVIPPRDGYLREIRELTERYNVLLIFDEIISGFRPSPGGAQQYYGVRPDITTLGKAMSNGFPLSAVAGVEDVMNISAPVTGRVSYSGTFNGYQLALAAAEATISEIVKRDVPSHLHEKTDFLVRRFNEMAAELNVAARAQGLAGQFQNYFIDRPVYNYRDAVKANDSAYKLFRESLLADGVFYLPYKLFHHGITFSHGDEEIRRIIEAYENALRKISDTKLGAEPTMKPSL